MFFPLVSKVKLKQSALSVKLKVTPLTISVSQNTIHCEARVTFIESSGGDILQKLSELAQNICGCFVEEHFCSSRCPKHLYGQLTKDFLQGLHTDGELVWPNAGLPLPCLALSGVALL